MSIELFLVEANEVDDAAVPENVPTVQGTKNIVMSAVVATTVRY